MPKVSIIIPTYNSAAFLPETLNSIFEQTFKDYEVIIVDDGSTDNTKKILQPYYEKVIYLYQHNSGSPARPRNLGISKARGDYIALFDSDDIMMPHKIERSVDFLDSQPDLAMVFTNFSKFSADSDQYPGAHLDLYKNFRNLQKVNLGEGRCVIKGQDAFEALFFDNYVGTSGVMVQRKVFPAVGLFDEEVSYGGLEDRDMWLRIAHLYDLGYLNILGHKYRVRHGSVSKRTLDSNLARAKVIKKHMAFVTSPRTRRQANLLLAQCFYGIGYHYQSSFDMKNARKYYLSGLKATFYMPCLKGLFISLLGNKFHALLKL